MTVAQSVNCRTENVKYANDAQSLSAHCLITVHVFEMNKIILN